MPISTSGDKQLHFRMSAKDFITNAKRLNVRLHATRSFTWEGI